MIQCPYCKTLNREYLEFCQNCSASLFKKHIKKNSFVEWVRNFDLIIK